MAEQQAADADEGQHGAERPVAAARRQVRTLVSQGPLEDRLPAPQMEMGPFRNGAHELVPFLRAAGVLLYSNGHGRLARAGVAKRSAIAVKRNSERRRSSRGSVRPKPV